MLEPKPNQQPKPNGQPEPNDRQPPLDLDDLSDLRNPQRGSPLFQHRLLHEAYLEHAAKGPSGRAELVSAPRLMTFENRAAFEALERHVLSKIEASLAAHGMSRESGEVEVRVLHRAVAEHPEGPEHHAYFEVLNRARLSVLAYEGTLESFSEGPVALQCYTRPEGGKVGIQVLPLLSSAAYRETVDSLVHGIRTEGAISPKSNWAAQWILRAIKGQEEFSEALHRARQQGEDLASTKIALLISRKTGAPALEFRLGKVSCHAELFFDEVRQQPGVFMRFFPRVRGDSSSSGE